MARKGVKKKMEKAKIEVKNSIQKIASIPIEVRDSPGFPTLEQEKISIIGGAPKSYETVNHPKHYNSHPSGIECIEIIRHFSFNIGAAIKHLWRLGTKPGASALEDIEKAIWYLQDEANRIRKENEAQSIAKELDMEKGLYRE
jgi:hypothetical protein